MNASDTLILASVVVFVLFTALEIVYRKVVIPRYQKKIEAVQAEIDAEDPLPNGTPAPVPRIQKMREQADAVRQSSGPHTGRAAKKESRHGRL
ncbi:MAG: hypothetical protein LBR80_15075 [Deltaproteobacteria bacterium]|jgi:hypothetical protein|nr:hypothetical protein [Deltaproteobacteria bacterium]